MPTQLSGSLFTKYKNDYDTFIETGSYIGDGIQSALNAGFNKIYSYELAPVYYEQTKKRFLNEAKLSLFFGDSRTLLKELLKTNKSKILFWLDAHFSGGDTEGGGLEETLEKELSVIKESDVSDFVLLIDDMNPELANFYIGKTQQIFDIEKITIEDGYQEHTGRVFAGSILAIKVK